MVKKPQKQNKTETKQKQQKQQQKIKTSKQKTTGVNKNNIGPFKTQLTHVVAAKISFKDTDSEVATFFYLWR